MFAGRAGRPPRLHLPRRSAAALRAPVPLLHERAHRSPQHPSPLRYVLLQRRVADLERRVDDRAPLPPVPGRDVPALRSPSPAACGSCSACSTRWSRWRWLRWAAARPDRAASWAGVAYALWWPAIEMPSWTMTENLHTVLFAGSLARAGGGGGAPFAPARLRRRARARPVAALARSVSTGFLPVAVLLALVGGRAADAPACAAALPILIGGLAVILPWTARNVFLVRDAVLIESAAFENIWFANNFADPARLARQREVIHGERDPAARAAGRAALRGARHPPQSRPVRREGGRQLLALPPAGGPAQPRRRPALAGAVAPRRQPGRSDDLILVAAGAADARVRVRRAAHARARAARRLDGLLPPDDRGRLPQRDPLPQRVRAVRAGRGGGRGRASCAIATRRRRVTDVGGSRARPRHRRAACCGRTRSRAGRTPPPLE